MNLKGRNDRGKLCRPNKSLFRALFNLSNKESIALVTSEAVQDEGER